MTTGLMKGDASMSEMGDTVRGGKTGTPVNWNKELVSVLKKVGSIALKVSSYVLNVLLTVILIGMITAVIVGTAFAVYIKDNLDLTIDADSFITAGQDTTTEVF